MVIFSAFMMWAYTWKEYVVPGEPKTRIWRPLWDSINYSAYHAYPLTCATNHLFSGDFFIEIMGSLKYFADQCRHRKGAKQLRVTTTDGNGKEHQRANFEEAFGFAGYQTQQPTDSDVRLRGSYDENIRLAPYTYADGMTPVPTINGGYSPISSPAPQYTPRYAPPQNEGAEVSLESLRAAHVHSPDPGELKRMDIK